MTQPEGTTSPEDARDWWTRTDTPEDPVVGIDVRTGAPVTWTPTNPQDRRPSQPPSERPRTRSCTPPMSTL